MTCLMEQASGWRLGRERAIWLSAAVLALSVHAGAAALALSGQGEPDGVPAASPAIMIELAPEPEAEQTDLNQITEDRRDAAEHRLEPQAVPAPEPPREEPQPEPIPTASIPPPPAPPEPRQEAEVDPLESQMLAALAEVPVPLPVARPVPEKPRRPDKPFDKADTPKKTVQRRKPDPEPASAPAVKAAAMVKQSNRTAARQQTAGASASPAAVSSWQSRLAAHLERRKRFPSAARGMQGTALVVFRIDDGGRVLSASLARSSGVGILDQAALAMVQRASPVPAPPPGASRTITAPVRFLRK